MAIINQEVLLRCMLLMLLGCDWAGDPYFGRSLFSQPLGNQVALIEAETDWQDLDYLLTSASEIAQYSVAALIVTRRAEFGWGDPATIVPVPFSIRLCYVFMSIVR